MNILVTGANRGIGAAIYGIYRDRGEPVIGTARAPTDDLLELDVRRSDHLADLAARIESPLDLLICNAGVFADKGHTLHGGFPVEAWEQTFATNVTGVFLAIQSMLLHLDASHRSSRAPKIAIISSRMGSSVAAGGGSYAYRASKAAVLNLGRNLAVDLKPRGIAVGIYHPGWVQTDMGGAAADITVDQSAKGLVERFDDLSLETTGTFLNYDGTPIPF